VNYVVTEHNLTVNTEINHEEILMNMTFPMSINLRIFCKDDTQFNGEWDYSSRLDSTNSVSAINLFT
jgi:hypothetical protein